MIIEQSLVFRTNRQCFSLLVTALRELILFASIILNSSIKVLVINHNTSMKIKMKIRSNTISLFIITLMDKMIQGGILKMYETLYIMNVYNSLII